MKNTLVVLLFFVSSGVKAQDPELLEVNWYIQSITIDGVIIPEPIYNPNGTDFSENPNLWQYSYCDAFESPIMYADQDTFSLLEDFPPILLGFCNNDITVSFGFSFQSIYYNDNGAINPFTYTIEINGDIKTLIVTNAEGNIATYRSEPTMNIDENNISQVSLFPNPTNNTITLASNTLSAATITLYDVLGKTIRSEQYSFNQSLKVTSLTKGIYFVSIATEDGYKQTLKFIKE